MNPAVTIIYLATGAAVQTAGLDVPLDVQVEALNLVGQHNLAPVPGAVRGEVWTANRVVATTFFTPVYVDAPPAEPAASAEAPAEEPAVEAPASEPFPEPTSEAGGEEPADSLPPAVVVPLSGKKKAGATPP